MASGSMSYRPLHNNNPGRVVFHKPLIGLGYCTPRKCLLALAAALVILAMLFRVVFTLRHAYSDYHLRTDTDGELIIVPKAITQRYKAGCLDQSQPAYYSRKGVDFGENRWLIAFAGTAWCMSYDQCRLLSQIPLSGSTHNAPVTHTFDGVLSADPSVNNFFADWNVILLISCDGAGFLGNNTNDNIHSNGANNLLAILDHLKYTTDIINSEETVLYGKEGGGISALVYANLFKSTSPQSKMSAISHNAILLDEPVTLKALHNLQENHLLVDGNIQQLTAEKLVSSIHSSIHTLLFSSVAPEWPMRIMYNCTTIACDNLKVYMARILHLAQSPVIARQCSLIITSCDYPFSLMPQEVGRTMKDNKSLYWTLFSWMVSRISNKIIVQPQDIQSALDFLKTKCPAKQSGFSPGHNTLPK